VARHRPQVGSAGAMMSCGRSRCSLPANW
jgi:hypothetical protein